MRLLSWILSIALHGGILLMAVYLATPSPMKVNLDVPVYQVDLVKLAPRKGVAVPKPKAAAKPAPPPKAKPAPKPQPKPKPQANEIAAKVEKPKPKPEAKKAPEKPKPKPAPKPKPKPKPEPKPKEKAPEKPQKSRQDLLNEALAQAKKDVQWKEHLQRKTVERELAALREQVAKQDATQADGAGGESEEGVSAGLEEIYAAQVKAIIRENWRFPSIPVDAALVATVYLRVGPEGSITESRLLATSGRPDFDSSVMKAVQETRQLPPPPGTVRQIRINFNLQDMQ